MCSTSYNNGNVPAFIAKLWHMLSNQKSDHLICWDDEGKKFIIKDNARFSSELLPMYYKHNNLASFIRQLNKYGFHKVMSVDSSNNEKGNNEFAHPDFIKGCPSQLSQIKRKISNNKDSEYKGDSILVTKLLQDVQELQARQDLFESKLSVMKNENDALWREQSILRQRHQKQQKIVNKLIQFLVTLLQQTRGLNLNNRRLPLILKDRSHTVEGLMAIKDRKRRSSPPSNIMCDVEPFYGCRNRNNSTIKNDNLALASLSNVGRSEISSLINPLSDEDDAEIPTTRITDNCFLEESSSSITSLPSSLITTTINPNFAVPLQEISPAIVQTPVRPFNVSNNEISLTNSKSPTLQQKSKSQDPLTKRRKSLKRKHSCNKSVKNDRIVVVPDLSNDPKNSDEQELHGNQLLQKNTDNSANAWDYSDINCDTLPIVTSPPSFSEITMTHNAGSDKLIEIQSEINREEIDNHLDMVQSDLDLLKNILHSEGLSLDASTLMGLFSAEEPLSLNFPDTGRNVTEENTEGEGGTEVVTYSPTFIDMNDFLDQTEDITTVSLPSPSPNELTTPIVEFANSPKFSKTS